MGRHKQHIERVYHLIGKPAPGVLAAGYVRYSGDMQDPASIITQKRRIQEYAESNDWHIIRWYEEPESSAKYEEIEKRSLFAELLADAGQEFHIVLCYTNDRWARNMAVAYSTLNQLRRKRVWWATSDGRWDIDRVEQDGFDVAFAMDTQINAAFVRRLSQRAIDGKEDRARDGYHNGSVPFGYLPPEYPKPPDGAPSTWKPPRMPVRRDPVTFPALVKIGELAAQGWSDSAIADELAGYVSTTPRFGQRPLSKDTISAMRRMWFPREFAPGCGRGTIETPSGELVEGRHEAAWHYDLWQQMVEVKSKLYRRPRTESKRRAHEFSRIVVCAGCRRALRADAYDRKTYYPDTSHIRKLPCPAFGSLSIRGSVVITQFGQLLASVHLPEGWRDTVAKLYQETTYDLDSDRVQERRTELEAEQKRTVQAFTKGYMSEHDLDTQIDRIRSELQALPPSHVRSVDERIEAAIVAGEMLIDMASYWEDAVPEERRDIVWTLLQLSGLHYDLERRAISGLLSREHMLHVLALALSAQWEREGDMLRLRSEFLPRKLQRSEMTMKPDQHKLDPTECEAARKLVADGKSLRQVAAHFHVSRMAIWRIMDDHPRSDGHGKIRRGGDA
jgi:DNA invertase Pin-like site-specific DNA recombinase